MCLSESTRNPCGTPRYSVARVFGTCSYYLNAPNRVQRLSDPAIESEEGESPKRIMQGKVGGMNVLTPLTTITLFNDRENWFLQRGCGSKIA